MENKYYTPEIEEFHVGFEYERLHMLINYDQKWHTEEVTHIKNDLTFFNKEIKENRIRVKYLNREDIESLGFMYNNKGNHENKDGFMICEQPLGKYTIHKDDEVLFFGTIKNKSELRRILKQIEV